MMKKNLSFLCHFENRFVRYHSRGLIRRGWLHNIHWSRPIYSYTECNAAIFTVHRRNIHGNVTKQWGAESVTFRGLFPTTNRLAVIPSRVRALFSFARLQVACDCRTPPSNKFILEYTPAGLIVTYVKWNAIFHSARIFIHASEYQWNRICSEAKSQPPKLYQ